jgi:hypothetical protein
VEFFFVFLDWWEPKGVVSESVKKPDEKSREIGAQTFGSHQIDSRNVPTNFFSLFFATQIAPGTGFVPPSTPTYL